MIARLAAYVAATIALATPTSAAPSHSLTDRTPAMSWAIRVTEDPDQPQWKKLAAQRLWDGECYSRSVRLTAYSPDPRLDPGTGGGPNGAWCCGSAATPLRYGHVAADWRHYPPGTVLYLAPPWDRSVIVVDNGPAVTGQSHVDLCLPTATLWQRYQRWEGAEGSGCRVWVIGRVGWWAAQ